jgi:hypothetical protein
MRFPVLFVVLAWSFAIAARGDQTFVLKVIENDYLQAKRGNSVVFHSIDLLVRPGQRFSLETKSGGNTFQLDGILKLTQETGFALEIKYTSPGGVDKHDKSSSRSADHDRPQGRDVRLVLNEPAAIRRVAIEDGKKELNSIRLMNVVTVVLTAGKSTPARWLFPASIEEGMMIDAIEHNTRHRGSPLDRIQSWQSPPFDLPLREQLKDNK